MIGRREIPYRSYQPEGIKAEDNGDEGKTDPIVVAAAGRGWLLLHHVLCL